MDNQLHAGDNLEFMRSLPSNSIQLIYLDVLYNTGKKFKDYDDNLGTPDQARKFYAPRLEECKRLLKDTGTLWLQADYHLIHYLKVWLDDVFGYSGLINEIIWCYKGGNSTKHYRRKHDTILIYSKTNKYIFNPQRIPYSEHTLKRCLTDEAGRLYYKTDRAKGGKQYLHPEGQLLYDYWTDIDNFSTAVAGRTGYDTQKPLALLERVIKTGTNPGDMVGDFFMGSGTTAEAALSLGRNFIGCDINPDAVVITANRIAKQTGG